VSGLHSASTLSVSLADQRQAVEEQEAKILGLQQAVDAARVALETEMKQVEGESSFSAFRLLAWFVCDPLPILF
jgi:hypothetical protein